MPAEGTNLNNTSAHDPQLYSGDMDRWQLRIADTLSNATEVLSNIDFDKKASQGILASVLLEVVTLEDAITNEMPGWLGSVIKKVLSESAAYQSIQDTLGKIDPSVRATVEAEVSSEMSAQETLSEATGNRNVSPPHSLRLNEAPPAVPVAPSSTPQLSASSHDASCGSRGQIYGGTYETTFLVIPVSVDGVEGVFENTGGFAFQVEPHPCEFRSPATCPRVIQKHEEVVSEAPKFPGYILRFSKPKLKEESMAVIRAKKLSDIIEGGGIFVDGA